MFPSQKNNGMTERIVMNSSRNKVLSTNSWKWVSYYRQAASGANSMVDLRIGDKSSCDQICMDLHRFSEEREREQNDEIEQKNDEFEHKNDEIDHKNDEIEHKNDEIGYKNDETEHKNDEIWHKNHEFEQSRVAVSRPVTKK